MTDELKRIPLSSIKENPAALRNVNRNTEEFQSLVASIKSRGVTQPILVRELPTTAGEEQQYGLVDGLHRYTGSLDAGLKDIPAFVKNLSDGDALEVQIINNLHKIETKPAEYTKGLMRLIASNPLLTMAQMAAKLNRSTEWLNQRLNLLKLKDEIQKMVDNGQINLTNGCMLGKLPDTEQNDWVERAMTLPPNEFGAQVLSRKKELDDAKRQGRAANPAGFVPVAHQRKMSEVKTEIENPQVGAILCKQFNASTPEEGFKLALLWTMHLDGNSLKIAEEKFNKLKEENEKRKAAAKAEREKKKAAAAAEAVASMSTSA